MILGFRIKKEELSVRYWIIRPGPLPATVWVWVVVSFFIVGCFRLRKDIPPR
jgi:hypothetical protein